MYPDINNQETQAQLELYRLQTKITSDESAPLSFSEWWLSLVVTFRQLKLLLNINIWAHSLEM